MRSFKTNFSGMGLWGAVGLSAMLSACGGGGSHSDTTPASPAPAYTLSGQVLTGAMAAQAVGNQALDNQALRPRSVQLARWDAPHIAGRVLVAAPLEAVQAAAQAAPQAGQSQRLLPQSVTQARPLTADLTLLPTPAGQSDQAFAALLLQQGLQAQPDYLYHTQSVPNDPGYPGNAGVPIGGVAYTQTYLSRIHAQAGWDALTAAGKPTGGVLVGVLDTGVDMTHPDLQGRLLGGYDFCSGADLAGHCVGEDNDPSEANPQDGHGTGVAGILGAASGNALGLTGLTWQGQNLLPVKVFNTAGAATSALARGLDYAVGQGVKVINMSLGIEGHVDDPILAQALSAAAAQDVLLVASAGNTPNDGLYYPASDPNVVAVGAVGNDDNTLACYSARPSSGQKRLDMVAPGGNAGGDATSYTACRTWAAGAGDILTLAPGGYELSDGTSEAAPQVAGAASLIRGARPDLSASEVVSLLKSSAQKTAAGNLLDVGAAVSAALNAAQGSAIQDAPYQLSVTAYQGSVLVGQSVTTGRMRALPAALPYTISPKLGAGRYTLKASLQYRAAYSGAASVNLSADTTQDITVR